MHIRSFTVSFILLFTTVVSLSQNTEIAAPACNADFAQILVQQQVMEGKSVTDPVKRIKILNRSADFLWPFDEPTSRSYFAEAWKMADDRFKEKGFESSRIVEKNAQIITNMLPDQRMEVVKAIAKRDKEWAKKLTDQILSDFEKAAKDRKGFEKDRELMELMNMASQYARTDPDLSLMLMRRVMRYPIYSGWFTGLYNFLPNRSLTDTIYAEALTTYQNESPRKLLYLSAYPFGNTRMFGVERYNMSVGQPDLQLNEVLARRFLDVFFTRIATFAASVDDINRAPQEYDLPEAAYMVSALRDIEPYIMERFPDLLGRFSEARGQATSLLNEDARKKLDDREKQQNYTGHTFEERIKQLEEAEGTGKLTDQMIVSLATRGTLTEEQFEILKGWLDKIKEEKPRLETVNYFWFRRAKLAVDEKRFDDAEKYALKVPKLENRATLFFDMARIYEKNQNDTSALFEILTRVSKLARSADNSVGKAQVLLGLSNMFEKVNSTTAMDELAEAMRVTNTLKDPDIFRTTLSHQIIGKGYIHYMSFTTPGFDLEKTFEDLSKKNFEMSLGNAKALEDRYFRTLAVIAVATNCAKNSKTPAKAKTK